MVSVSFDKTVGKYRIRHNQKVLGWEDNKKSAIARAEQYGKEITPLKNGQHRKNYSGKRIGNLIVIGDTGENIRGSQSVIVKNELSGEYFVRQAASLFSGGYSGTRGYKPNVHKYGNSWVAKICLDGKNYQIGSFQTRKEGIDHYFKALNKYLASGTIPANKTKPRSNTGHKGIRKIPNGKYLVRLMVRGKTVFSKTFNTLDEAIAARKAAEHKYLGGNN